MSEKNEKKPEIIFRDLFDFDKQEIHQEPYILKSKYDELLYRLGEVECYVIDLRREKDELSLENARLAADLAKVEAELKECKEGFTKQIDEFYELRKVTIDTINQRNEFLIENEKLKAELKKVKGELPTMDIKYNPNWCTSFVPDEMNSIFLCKNCGEGKCNHQQNNPTK